MNGINLVHIVRSDKETPELWHSNDFNAGLVDIRSGYGYPRLRSAGAGSARWTKQNDGSQWQKGSGWQANLIGGDQSGGTPWSAGANWGAIFVPVDELAVTDLRSAKWAYYMTNAEVYGVNIVIWMHDPDDFDKRVEVTQSGSAVGLAKAQYWNAHEFPDGDAEFFWYGENAGSPDICATAGTLYTWEQFQLDAVFSTWKIYRISIEYGWYTTGTFDPVWVSELKINNRYIPLEPSAEELAQRHPIFAMDIDGESTETDPLSLDPQAPYHLKNLRIKFSKGLATSETLTISVDAINGANHDVILYKRDLSVDSVLDADIPFDDDFQPGDIILVALSANTGSAVWGCTATYELINK